MGEGVAEGILMPANQYAQAYQAIGEYFCAFSAVEHELGAAIKLAYGLQDNDASDAIVAALGDFSRKARLVEAAIKVAKNADGSNTSEAWKASAAETVRKALDFNDPDRQLLAHSLLQPNADGSVTFVRLQVRDGKVTGKDGYTWSHENFNKKIADLNEVRKELQAINSDLHTVKIRIPAGELSWMSGNPMYSFSHRASGPRMSELDGPTTPLKKSL